MGRRDEILIIFLSGLGPFVTACPALEALRAHHRGARITMLASPDICALAEDSPYVDAAEPFSDQDVLAAPLRLGQQIRKGGFSRVYDFTNSEFTEKVFAAARPRTPPWVGTARGAKFEVEPVPASVHPVDAFLLLIQTAGVEPVSSDPDVRWAITARANAPRLQPAYFGLSDPYVILAPTGSGEGGPQRWPTARWAGLAVRLVAQGVGVALASEPQDRAAVRAVVSACPQAKDIAARGDLTQTAALAVRASAGFGHADGAITQLLAAGGARTIYIEPSKRGVMHPPRGDNVMSLTTDNPSELSVEYAAALFRMYGSVG